MLKKENPQIITENNPFNKSHSVTALQKNFNNPKPKERFLKQRISNNGIDSVEGFGEFMNKDLIKPFRHSLYNSIKRPYRVNWALKTNKQCSVEELLPKVQQFKKYVFPSRSQKDIRKYQDSFLPSDYISIRIPKIKKGEENDSFLMKKTSYGVHSETMYGWAPKSGHKTLSNNSSVKYNILSNDLNTNDAKSYILDHRINFRKKGVGEYSDVSKVYRTNFNNDYQTQLNKDDHLFHNYKGIFSHVYDVAHRNGNLIVPFRNGGQKNRIEKKIQRATAADENQKFPISVNYYFMVLSRHYDSLSKNKDDFTSIVNKFIYSTILLPEGYQKERMVNFAIQNDSLNIFEYKVFLEKLLTYQLVYIDDLNKFKGNCPKTHLNFNYEKAIFEHNLYSLSKIFANISFNSLVNFMKLKIEIILDYTLKMIIEGKIKAIIDEENNFILFEKESTLSLNFDKQIQNFCLKALYLSDYIKSS